MYRVILVDDEYWALIGIEKLFQWKEYGFTIIGAYTDPHEALCAIHEQRPDAVFCDICMPELSGLDLIKSFDQQKTSVAFVVISGYGEFSYAQEALRLNAFDYCLKPMNQAEADALLAKLKKHLTGEAEVEQETADYESGNTNFNNLLRYVNEHFTSQLYLHKLSTQFFLNETYCSELFRKTTGKTYSEYLHGLRVSLAQNILTNTSVSIQEVAVRSGYNDYYHFNKVFKKFTGVTPAKYRKLGRSRRDAP